MGLELLTPELSQKKSDQMANGSLFVRGRYLDWWLVSGVWGDTGMFIVFLLALRSLRMQDSGLGFVEILDVFMG